MCETRDDQDEVSDEVFHDDDCWVVCGGSLRS